MQLGFINDKDKYMQEFLETLAKFGMSRTEIDRVMASISRQRETIENSDAEVTRRNRAAEIAQKRRKAATAAQKAAASEKAERERIQKATSMELPLDFDNAFFSDERARGVHADSVSDGLIYSLSDLGEVNIEYISAITGADMKTVITSLKGGIYQNPEKWNECFYKGWETAEEYLSGNLIAKYNAAAVANAKYGGFFADNNEFPIMVRAVGISQAWRRRTSNAIY